MSPPSKISNPHDSSFLHLSVVPPCFSAMIGKDKILLYLKYVQHKRWTHSIIIKLAIKFPNVNEVKEHSTFLFMFDTNYRFRYGLDGDNPGFIHDTVK
jgi:hypothetical protein